MTDEITLSVHVGDGLVVNVAFPPQPYRQLRIKEFVKNVRDGNFTVQRVLPPVVRPWPNWARGEGLDLDP